jgi:opacity protein-like surface antigen
MRLSTIAASAVLFTIPAIAQAGSFDGFYVGAEAGSSFTSFTETQSSLYTGTEKNSSFAANGVIGGGVAGYGVTLINNFYLGAEIDAIFGDRSYTDSAQNPDNPYVYKITAGKEFGFSARPGYLINDHAMVFGLFGVARVPLTNTWAGSEPNVTFKSTQTAFRLGGGTEIAISGPLTLRVDYTHIFLSKVTVNDTTVGYSANYEPSEDQVKVGIAYHF